MPAMPLPAEKDVILLKLDLYTKFSSSNRIQAFRDALSGAGARQAAKIFADTVCLNRAEKRHMREWLSNPFDWDDIQGESASDRQALYKLLRRRLVAALDRILPGGSEAGLPLDAYWVCFPDQGQEVRVRLRPRVDGHSLGFDILTPPIEQP